MERGGDGKKVRERKKLEEYLNERTEKKEGKRRKKK